MAEPTPRPAEIWTGTETQVRRYHDGTVTIVLTDQLARTLAVALHAFDDGLAPRLRPLRQALDWHLVGDPNSRARGPARRG